MDTGARTDRRPDGRADPRRRRSQLALSARSGLLRWALPALTACAALPGGPARAVAAERAPPASYVWHLPRGFPVPAVPADNPMSEAKAALGERLFFDPRLSVTGRYSCSSCHDPARAFSQELPVAVGATGELLAHNALALVNVAYNISFGWSTPQVRSLEAQMLTPMLSRHPVELGLQGRQGLLARELAADARYRGDFARAYPDDPSPVTFTHVVQSIACFERTLISGGSAFDAYVFGGEHAALSPAAKRGMALFYSRRIGCALCHSGFNFSGNWRDAQGETGRAGFAREGTSAAPLRVPTLRNVALTAPYMHDGRFATLAQVLAHYSDLGQRSAAARPDPRLPRAPLTATERSDLIAFLDSLTDPGFLARYRGAARAP